MGVIQQVMLATKGVGSGGASPWAGITGATESPTGKLTKTASNNWGNCGAVSVLTMAGDCRLTVYWENLAENFFIGIDPASSCNTYTGIDFGFFCNGGGTPSAQIWESGVFVTTFLNPPANKAMLVIERIGTDYDYYYLEYSGARPDPDDAGRTHQRGPITGSGSTLYVNLAMFWQTIGVIDYADVIWEAI